MPGGTHLGVGDAARCGCVRASRWDARPGVPRPGLPRALVVWRCDGRYVATAASCSAACRAGDAGQPCAETGMRTDVRCCCRGAGGVGSGEL